MNMPYEQYEILYHQVLPKETYEVIEYAISEALRYQTTALLLSTLWYTFGKCSTVLIQLARLISH